MRDLDSRLVRYWRMAFASFPEVAMECGDLLDLGADAYVSPANSYGIMDGNSVQ